MTDMMKLVLICGAVIVALSSCDSLQGPGDSESEEESPLTVIRGAMGTHQYEIVGEDPSVHTFHYFEFEHEDQASPTISIRTSGPSDWNDGDSHTTEYTLSESFSAGWVFNYAKAEPVTGAYDYELESNGTASHSLRLDEDDVNDFLPVIDDDTIEHEHEPDEGSITVSWDELGEASAYRAIVLWGEDEDGNPTDFAEIYTESDEATFDDLGEDITHIVIDAFSLSFQGQSEGFDVVDDEPFHRSTVQMEITEEQ